MPKTTRRIFIRNLEVQASIGVYEHERAQRQPLRICIEARVALAEDYPDAMGGVVSYELFRDSALALASGPHINLVETFADQLLAQCTQSALVREIDIRVEKTRVFPDAEGAGVSLHWNR